MGVTGKSHGGSLLFSHHGRGATKEGFSLGPQRHYIIFVLLGFMFEWTRGGGARGSVRFGSGVDSLFSLMLIPRFGFGSELSKSLSSR